MVAPSKHRRRSLHLTASVFRRKNLAKRPQLTCRKEDCAKAGLAQLRLWRLCLSLCLVEQSEIDEVHGKASHGPNGQPNEAEPLQKAVLRKDEGHRFEKEVEDTPGK